MMLVLVVAVLAVTLALVSGGESLSRLRLRAVRLLVVVALLQVLTGYVAPHQAAVRLVVLVLCVALVGLFLWGNRTAAGVPLLAVGLLLNVLVVVANLGMPVSVDAAARAGLRPADLHLGDDPLHERMTSATRLGALGDTIPVALPLRPQVVSPGDVLVASGVGLLVVVGAGRTRPRRGQYRDERPTVLAKESTTRGSYS